MYMNLETRVDMVQTRSSYTNTVRKKEICI